MLLHEIKIQQRKIKTAQSKAVQKDFYLNVFILLCRMSFDVLDLKLLRQYANHLKPFLKNGEPFTGAVLEYKYVHVENCFHFLNGEGLAYKNKALAAINRIAGPALVPRDKKAAAYYHFCMAGYAKDFADNQDVAIEHATRALESAKQWAPGSDDAFVASAYGMTATILSNRSEFEKAFDVYTEAFARYPAQLQGSFYHVYMYACIMLVCGQYAQLKKHLHHYMEKYLDSNAALYYRLETMRMYALLLLHQKQYAQALHYIRGLQSTRRKEITETADIFIRMIDNLYLLLTADYPLATTQSRKNLKYLKRKNYTYQNCDYNHLFYAISLVCKIKTKRRVPPAELGPYLQASKKGFMKMYGGLLDIALAQ